MKKGEKDEREDRMERVGEEEGEDTRRGDIPLVLLVIITW